MFIFLKISLIFSSLLDCRMERKREKDINNVVQKVADMILLKNFLLHHTKYYIKQFICTVLVKMLLTNSCFIALLEDALAASYFRKMMLNLHKL